MKPLHPVLRLIFPPKCPFCGRVLRDPEAPACHVCQPVLPWREGVEKVTGTLGCCAPLIYQGEVREAVHRFKFSSRSASARPFGLLMAQCVRDWEGCRPAGITWVPLSRRGRAERGFDQGELLARRLGEALGLPVVQLLEKPVHTPRQSAMKTPSARRANVLGAYRLNGGREVPEALLLVDDVMTTGATLEECAGVLRGGGAERIWCVTLARAGK